MGVEQVNFCAFGMKKYLFTDEAPNRIKSPNSDNISFFQKIINMILSRSTAFLVSLSRYSKLVSSQFFLYKVWIAVSIVNAQSGQNIQVETCQVEITNSATELVKLEHKPVHNQLLIQQNSDLTQIQQPILMSQR